MIQAIVCVVHVLRGKQERTGQYADIYVLLTEKQTEMERDNATLKGERNVEQFIDHRSIEEDHVFDALRYCCMERTNVIYPEFDYKYRLIRNLCRYMYRKTHSKRFITGWECNGKRYSKDTPEEIMKEKPRLIHFERYYKQPETEESVKLTYEKIREAVNSIMTSQTNEPCFFKCSGPYYPGDTILIWTHSMQEAQRIAIKIWEEYQK